MKMIWSSLARVAMAFGMTAAAMSALAQEPIRIGAVNPYTGPLALYGDEVSRAFQVAINARNAKGGVLGRKIELIRGDAINPQQGISAVDQLVTKDKADILTGTYTSGISNAASDAALRNKKLYWENLALAEDLTDRKLPNYLRSGPSSAHFADVGVKAVIDMVIPAINKTVKDASVWIEHEDSIYGKSIGEAQKAKFEAAGIKVAGISAHNARALDMGDTILKARRARPDVWMQVGYVPDTNLLLKTMREQGFKPPAIVITGTGDTYETVEAIGGEMLEGMFIVSYPRDNQPDSFGPGNSAFLDAYKKLYNRDPIAPQALVAYAGMNILFDAIEQAGSLDYEKIKAAAMAMDKPLHTYPAGFGVKFDDKGQNQRAQPIVSQWQSAKLVQVYPVNIRLSGTKLTNTPRAN